MPKLVRQGRAEGRRVGVSPWPALAISPAAEPLQAAVVDAGTASGSEATRARKPGTLQLPDATGNARFSPHH